MSAARGIVRAARGGRRLAAALVAMLAACQDASAPEPAGVAGAGEVIWRRAVVDEMHVWFGMPAADDSLVYFDVEDGVMAVHQASGRIAWRLPIRTYAVPYSRRIEVHDGLLVIDVDWEQIVGVDSRAPAVRWRVSLDTLSFAVGGLDDFAYYTGSRGGYAYALSRDDGAIIWRVPMSRDWEYGSVTSAAPGGDTVFFSGWFKPRGPGHRDLFVAALDRRTGTEHWRFETTAGEHITRERVALSPALVLVHDDFGHAVHALDRATGTLRWTFGTDPGYAGPDHTPVVSGTTVYFGSPDTHIYAADLETGAIRWRTGVHSSPLNVAVCGDHVFANDLGAHILDRRSGAYVRTVLTSDRTDGREQLTSHFLPVGSRLFASGNRAVYGLGC